MSWAKDNSDLGMIATTIAEFQKVNPEVTCVNWNLEDFDLKLYFEDDSMPIHIGDFVFGSEWWEKMLDLDEKLTEFTLSSLNDLLED